MKIKDAELIGIPFTIVLGSQWVNKDKLEFKVRTINEETDLALSIPEFRQYLRTKVKPLL
jgi:prolyl-tRNA synthetase